MTTVKHIEIMFEPSFVGLEFDFMENGKKKAVRIMGKDKGMGILFAFTDDLKKQFFLYDNVFLKKGCFIQQIRSEV